MTISADRRGWGRGWPQNNSSKMVTIRAKKSGVTLAVHKAVAPILQFCIDTVEERGYLFDYGPKDVNDDWGYANRPIGNTSIPSNHSWGLAVDLDAQQYPQGQRKRRPPQWVDDVFAKYRFDNGAPWSNPDPMHYEFNGTPADARFLVASLAGHAIAETPAPTPPSAPPLKPPTPPPYFGPKPTVTRPDEENPMLRELRWPNRKQPSEMWMFWPNRTRTGVPNPQYRDAYIAEFGPPVVTDDDWRSDVLKDTYKEVPR